MELGFREDQRGARVSNYHRFHSHIMVGDHALPAVERRILRDWVRPAPACQVGTAAVRSVGCRV